MGFTLKYYYGGFYPYFKLDTKMTDQDFKDFINVLQAILDMEKPFVFLVDARDVTDFNFLYCGWEVVKWMRKNKPKIKRVLQGSAVIFKNKMVVDILNWIFERQPPVSPNKVTLDLDEGECFLEKYIPEDKKNKQK